MVEADHMTPDEVIEWLEEEARVAVQDARHQFLVKNDEGRAHYRAKAAKLKVMAETVRSMNVALLAFIKDALARDIVARSSPSPTEGKT